MKTKLILLSFSIFFVASLYTPMPTYSQCTPMTAEECPDPENNGEICPDSLADGFLNQFYSQEATILAPLADTTGIALHHLTLKSVDNLPPGLTWVSNAPGNEFLAGNYYCILMDGTPVETGTFPLKIVVDIYVSVLGFPILAGTVTDSTSLAIEIIDDTGFGEISASGSIPARVMPNPFHTWTSIGFFNEDPGPARLEVYTIQGHPVDETVMQAKRGQQFIHYNGAHLPAGPYIFRLHTGSAAVAGMLIKQ